MPDREIVRGGFLPIRNRLLLRFLGPLLAAKTTHPSTIRRIRVFNTPHPVPDDRFSQTIQIPHPAPFPFVQLVPSVGRAVMIAPIYP